MSPRLCFLAPVLALVVAACGSEDPTAPEPAPIQHSDAGVEDDAQTADSALPDAQFEDADDDASGWPDAATQDAEDAADSATAADALPDQSPAPYVTIVFPSEGESVPNPVQFLFTAGGGVESVWFEVDDWPLQTEPIPATETSFTYSFSGVNKPRHVVLKGLDTQGQVLATDEVTFTPVSCVVADQPGFNHYTVAVMNDTIHYPKDGTYPYCWEAQGSVCGANWGMVHDGVYTGEVLFSGGGDCFCSGHTLEVFMRAYGLWQQDAAVETEWPFTVGSHQLAADDVDGGDFYQHWQGYGAGDVASSANAFAAYGIGEVLDESRWDEVLPGDYVNLSRSTGSGHAVIFVNWVVENGVKVGLRYYGCNSRGDSCPDPNDPLNTESNSGPSFVTEYFVDHGGRVLPQYLFIGRVYMPSAY